MMLDPVAVPVELWPQALSLLPIGVAILSVNGTLRWANQRFQASLEELQSLPKRVSEDILIGSFSSETSSYSLHGEEALSLELLTQLAGEAWEHALDRAQHCSTSGEAGSGSFQFVSQLSRNVVHCRWTLLVTSSTETDRMLVLTLEDVTEATLNERMLATSARSAQRARRRADALSRLTQRVNEAREAQDVMRIVMEEAATFFETVHAAILGPTDDGGFQVIQGLGLAPDQNELPADRTVASRALSLNEPVMLADTAGAGVITPILNGRGQVHSLIACPLQYDKQLHGLLEIYFDQPARLPGDARRLMAAFANQAAIGLHRAALFSEVAEQGRRLQSILDHAPVAIVYFDPAGRVVVANRNAREKYAAPNYTLTGLHYDDFLIGIPSDLFPSVLAGQPFHASHYLYESREGHPIFCDVSLIPVHGKDRDIVGMLLLAFEVTELVEAQQAANAARQEAERALAESRAAHTQMLLSEKMRALGELASGVAHDFNNALMIIMGHTELAKDSASDPEEVIRDLSIVLKACEDARSLIQRLNQFARQRVAPHGSLQDINQIVRDVIEMTRPRWKDGAQREGKVYQVEAHLETLPSAIVEPSGLREVLVNLVQNALNAMPDGGTLRFYTRPTNEGVQIELVDSGVGMTPEVLSRIFDPFFTTRGVEGTGLGLSVSWTIIERHGGTIWAESAPSEGTRFFINLPVGDGQIARLTVEYQPVEPRPGSRILVVDDDPIVASVLNTLMLRQGHQVVVEHSAQAALERLEEDPGGFDLLLSDHGMPGMTGLQLTAVVRERFPSLPIVLLTGWGGAILDNTVADARPDAILAKPINQTDLHDAVARVLREKAEVQGGSPPQNP